MEFTTQLINLSVAFLAFVTVCLQLRLAARSPGRGEGVEQSRKWRSNTKSKRQSQKPVSDFDSPKAAFSRFSDRIKAVPNWINFVVGVVVVVSGGTFLAMLNAWSTKEPASTELRLCHAIYFYMYSGLFLSLCAAFKPIANSIPTPLLILSGLAAMLVSIYAEYAPMSRPPFDKWAKIAPGFWCLVGVYFTVSGLALTTYRLALNRRVN